MPGDRPSVTVIVPVYNGERFLAEALTSICQQDYEPLDVLVVDDGSTDGSAAVGAEFPAVQVLRKLHSGLAATLNHGIRHASAELLAFLDADDRWLSGKLARQVSEFQQRPELDMVFGHVQQFTVCCDATGAREIFSTPQPGYTKITLLARRTTFAHLGEFDETGDRHTFLEWYARAQQAKLQVVMVPEVLAERRIHETNYGLTNPTEQRRKYLSTLRAVIQQQRLDPTVAGD